MKCSKRGGELEEGYVSLISDYPSGLYWSKEEPPSFWAFHSRMPWPIPYYRAQFPIATRQIGYEKPPDVQTAN
jgi:hypothetical protein